MAMQSSKKRDLDLPVIPDRLYFKIGDVARICEVETYVLRFWETQFPQLKPNKSGTGQRLYRRRDVELALKIKQLVHIEGYTLAGARQVMGQVKAQANPAQPMEISRPTAQLGPQPVDRPEREPQSRLPLSGADSGKTLDTAAATIAQVRAELRELANLLASPDPQPQPRRRARVTAMPSSTGFLFPAS